MDEFKMTIKLDMVRVRATLDARTCAHCAACDGRAIRASEMSDHFASCEHVKAGGRDQACRCVFTLIADPTDAALALEIAGIDEIRDHLMRVLKAFPPKLTPSEVTEPGFYWTDGDDEWWPAVTGTLQVVLVCRADRDVGKDGLEVFEPGRDYGNNILERGIDGSLRYSWFIGPLVPPTVE